MENRAAVFTSQPQDVEVFQDGVWWPGSLLGWRHDTQGSCQVWVRIDDGGAGSTIWTDLGALRLPGSAPQPSPASLAAPGDRFARSTDDDPAATRELRRIGDGPTSARRGRPSLGPVTVTEGAGESVPSWRLAAARADGSGTSGRHRAPAVGGRHRAADTETFPAVTADPAVRQQPSWPMAVEDGWPVVVEEPRPAAERSWAPRTTSDSDVFTRPLRLGAVSAAPAPQPRGSWGAGRRGI